MKFPPKTSATKALLLLKDRLALEDFFLLGECFLSLAIMIFMMGATTAHAQTPQQNAAGMENEHQHEMQSVPQSLSDQIGNLSRQVSELQAKVREQGMDAAAMKANGDERRQKMSMGASGSAPQSPATPTNVQTIPAAQAPQMGMMPEMMNMMNSVMGGMAGGPPMGQATSMGPSSFLSELPGFPGASHLYHIGSTNFFLDHPQHITLSLEQQSRLGEIRMKALMRRSEFNRKIQEGEEQLWLLTAVDQPNSSLVEAKIREVEKLRSDLRVAFIKDVGEAATALTDAQRMALLGQSTPSSQTTKPSTGTPQSNGAMGDM